MKQAAILEIKRGNELWRYPLKDETTVIGRAPDNQITLDDALVSRRHVRLEWRNDRLTVSDLGSSNGTRLNGVELEPKVPRPLQSGDQLEVGHHTLQLHLFAIDAATGRSPELEATLSHQGEATMHGSRPQATRPTPRLLITTPEWTRPFPLEKEVLTLGRDPENDIAINDRTVSRRHAELRRVGDGYEMIDLESANGFLFNGEKVGRKTLAHGDRLWIRQSVSLTYQAAPEEDAERTFQTVNLAQKQSLTIGRDPQSAIALDHPLVSLNHARIAQRPDGSYAIEDTGSSNGTYVEGELLQPGEVRALRPGNVVRIGPIKFIFAPQALEQVDESRDLRLDALHLNQPVRKDLNLLKDISLSVYPREFVTIVGVSGAGKSTLLDALTGFRPARQGHVMVNGTDLYQNFDAFRTDLGYVPQDDIIHKELTVYNALDYAARLRLPADTTPAERQQRVAEVLDVLGLNERRDVPIHRLSGGQRKRVSIGVELLTEPGLFFLDEATSGLDPGTESQMMRLLRKLADQGQTVLIITHATKNVMLCDQVAFLARGGYLAYFGPPEEALAYFGVPDFDAIYEKLTEELSPEAWAEKYRQSAQYEKYVAGRLQEKYGPKMQPSAAPLSLGGRGAGGEGVPTKQPTRPGTQVKRASAARQLWVLSARYLHIIRKDRINLLLLFLIAPLLGAIDLIAWPRDILDPVTGAADRTMTMLFLGSIFPFLVGALSSVREIVKESAVYRRERTVNLKIGPYLLSKIWIGFLFALYHAAALFILKAVAVDFSHLPAANLIQIYVTLALGAMSGVLWGLLISALVPREEQAMLLVIVVVVVQMVFTGGILPLSDLGPPGQVLGNATSSKWVFQALTAATEVKSGDCEAAGLEDCRLPGIQQYQSGAERQVLLNGIDERFGDVFGVEVITTWAAIGAIMAILFVLLYILQKRKDVI